MTLFYADELAEARQLADVVDLFAGPGGWSVALHQLGAHDIGIEFERWACATRRAAGHPTIEADVSHLDPLDFAPARGVIASPPCQAFSAAGSGKARDLVPELVAAIEANDWTARPDPDPKVWLVLEVGRWIDALLPEWIALEQVPAVLPLWHEYARWLQTLGYSTWTGILNAADYGVPQTRKRAILLAHANTLVDQPPPTHSADAAAGTLPWVTMADALGWGMTGRPAFALAPGTGGGGGTDPAGVGGSGARSQLYSEKEEGRWLVNTGRDWKPGGTRDDAQTIDASEHPAPTLTGATGRQWQIRTGQRSELADGLVDYARDVEEPAPTVTGRADLWTFQRPATTVLGDARLWPPGHKINADDRARLGDEEAAARYGDRAGSDAIRLDIADALVLQSFPADYPVRGTKTRQFEQVGNAIPPLLAWHILRRLGL